MPKAGSGPTAEAAALHTPKLGTFAEYTPMTRVSVRLRDGARSSRWRRGAHRLSPNVR